MRAPRFALFALSAALLASTGVRAQAGPPSEAPVAAPERSELPESVLRAERQTGGEVLRAERMQRDGREVYRLKVLTPDGRVRIMREDPRERRRDAWRERHGGPGRDPFGREEAPLPPAAPRPADVPSDLGLPETLPPAERGDRS